MARRGDVTVEFVFTGRFERESFAAFARHRAGRLDLTAGEPEFGAGRASIRVSGQADLVDAFEMALSLGPLDCLIDEVAAYPVGTPA
jgi:hypothetical protein